MGFASPYSFATWCGTLTSGLAGCRDGISSQKCQKGRVTYWSLSAAVVGTRTTGQFKSIIIDNSAVTDTWMCKSRLNNRGLKK